MEAILNKRSMLYLGKAVLYIIFTNIFAYNKNIGMEENFKKEYIQLVNEKWLNEKKKDDNFVLMFFEKKDDNNFISGDVNISFENKNGIKTIVQIQNISEKLSLDKKKWALFEITTENEVKEKEIKYLYCSDIESYFEEAVGDLGIFRDKKDIKELKIVACDSSAITRTSAMFAMCSELVSLNLENLNTQNVVDMRNMFGSCEKLKNLSLFKNVSKVVNMAYLFYNCRQLPKINGLENWDTKNVVEVSYMFYRCQCLETIDNLDQWNICGVTNLSNMFAHCKKLKQINGIDKWNTSNVKNIECMFSNCENLENLNLYGWNSSKLENVTSAFDKCKKLKNIVLNKNNEDLFREKFKKYENICCFLK